MCSDTNTLFVYASRFSDEMNETIPMPMLPYEIQTNLCLQSSMTLFFSYLSQYILGMCDVMCCCKKIAVAVTRFLLSLLFSVLSLAHRAHKIMCYYPLKFKKPMLDDCRTFSAIVRREGKKN